MPCKGPPLKHHPQHPIRPDHCDAHSMLTSPKNGHSVQVQEAGELLPDQLLPLAN